MRALNVPAAGAKPELSDLPVPEVTDGTVLIKVKAAGLNPVDNAIAAGMVAAMMPHKYPLILGRDAAGIVEAVGPGVEHVAIGDEVIGHVLFVPPIQAGTIAEYALVDAAAVCAKPAELDFVTAAAIPLAGAGATVAIEAIDPQPGQTVLINGATGGVGSYAVQLLAARGVTVVATGTPDDAERLTALGATTVVDYTEGNVPEQVRATYPDAEALAGAGLTGSTVMAGPIREVTAPLAAQAAAGTLSVDVRTVLPLDQAADGLATIAAGKARGKIVVKIAD